MKFFLDEIFVADCLHNLNERLAELELIVNVMDEVASSEPLNLYYIHDLHSLDFQGANFAELLYAHCNDGDYRDLILRFDMALERGECVLTEDGRPLGSCIVELAEFEIGGCISGFYYSDEDWWRSSKMCSAFDQNSLQKAVRFLFNASEMPPEQLDFFGDIMFPNIYFHASPSDLKRMGIGYREHAQNILDHLSYLNDFAVADFENELPAQIIQLAASKGVEISPESVNTRGNRGAMLRRCIDINNANITCEWHTKFTYDRGRIHFHARPGNYHKNIRQVVGAKVIVGLIVEHLPT